MYIDGVQIVIWDGVHFANSRVCSTLHLTRGLHRIYIIAFEYTQDSQLEVPGSISLAATLYQCWDQQKTNGQVKQLNLAHILACNF